MADNERPVPEQDPTTGRFVTGNIGGGRPKGARAKLGEQFLEDMQIAWEREGAAVINRVMKERPQDFLKVVASLMPKDFNLNVSNVDTMTDDELIQRIRRLDAAIRPFLDVEGTSVVNGGVGSSAAH